MTDWLACAAAGAAERAPRSLLAAGEDLVSRVAFAGAAGHVLDFDDTFPDGLAHLSAPTAPAAMLLAASLNRSLRDALAAYAAGFEAMGAVAAASHPALYNAGWHPTAVCGPIGAVVASAELLELGDAERRSAVAVALLRAGGTRGAFGSDGKAIQVGLAAAAGVQAALAAQAGASVDARAVHGPMGFEAVLGARWGEPARDRPPAIAGNWTKLHPSCLGTHAPIDAAAALAGSGYSPGDAPLEVLVHPLARQAAHLDAVEEPLGAKFSIPYCVAFTLARGAPTVDDFQSLDASVAAAASRVTVIVDSSLPEFGAVLRAGDRELARMPCPRGAPERPIAPDELAAKVRSLAGNGLLEATADLDAPAADALRAAGLDAPLKSLANRPHPAGLNRQSPGSEAPR